MTQYKDATTAARNWYFTAQKLKATDGNKKGKRRATDDQVAPQPHKRGRIDKNDDNKKEVMDRVKSQADETGA